LRGAWETPMRLSLLRNKGDGSFDDVTVAAGLAEPIATESAAWGDYDNDGLVDVFVCGEYLPPGRPSSSKLGDPRNRCRLYHNRGDGTFVNVADLAGVTNERCAKGSAWGDYDDDGRLDLFVSNMGQPCRLYHNQGEGTFRDVAPELGVTGTDASFACWFWDYDNDGLLDLYVNDYRARVAEVLASVMGVGIEGSSRPRLYRNLGVAGYSDVTKEVGLDRAMAPMGANFGDVDNDGYLDIYLGTGDMSYEGLDVNLMFRNALGGRFEDITTSSGTGHLQKGHGVSFADWDCDGDLDLFVELGGGTPGDQSYNALFQNPGLGRHWLKVKLVGTKTNRAALGAKIRVDLKAKGGQSRSIHRTVGNNSSFGGNSLVETIGLSDLTSVDAITVSWPTSGTKQIFHDLAVDQAIEITEGATTIKVLHQPPQTPPRP
jgi:FG-GAP-like repeat/ASPIC and UnbV